MSHSNGKVVFEKDGHVMHCEYDGTSDYMIPNLYNTQEEVNLNWRKHPPAPVCSCESMEEVTIISDYGRGFEWFGEACRVCAVINSKHLERYWKEDEDYINNKFSWFEK